MKANKEQRITDILAEIEAGHERAEVLAKVGKNWQISPRTFDRLWKEAQRRHAETLSRQEQQRAARLDAAAAERLNKAILTKDEALEELTKIAKGTARSVAGEIIAPSHGDSIAAIRQLATMQGWEAPKKIDKLIRFGLDAEEYTDAP